MSLAGLWVIFSLSFVMSLSGALMPGPLLTYTIASTMGADRRGWLMGARVVLGHAALEGVLLSGLVLGVVEFLRQPIAAKIIGVVGALLLAYMGIGLIREALRGRAIQLGNAGSPGPGQDPPRDARNERRLPPSVAGALVSMSNPYFWIWWITIGSAFLMRFDVTIQRWQALVAFFLGHELGDFGWYTLVSSALHLGRKSIPRTATTVILGVCGVIILGFGAWLGISPFLGR